MRAAGNIDQVVYRLEGAGQPVVIASFRAGALPLIRERALRACAGSADGDAAAAGVGLSEGRQGVGRGDGGDFVDGRICGQAAAGAERRHEGDAAVGAIAALCPSGGHQIDLVHGRGQADVAGNGKAAFIVGGDRRAERIGTRAIARYARRIELYARARDRYSARAIVHTAHDRAAERRCVGRSHDIDSRSRGRGRLVVWIGGNRFEGLNSRIGQGNRSSRRIEKIRLRRRSGAIGGVVNRGIGIEFVLVGDGHGRARRHDAPRRGSRGVGARRDRKRRRRVRG